MGASSFGRVCWSDGHLSFLQRELNRHSHPWGFPHPKATQSTPDAFNSATQHNRSCLSRVSSCTASVIDDNLRLLTCTEYKTSLLPHAWFVLASTHKDFFFPLYQQYNTYGYEHLTNAVFHEYIHIYAEVFNMMSS